MPNAGIEMLSLRYFDTWNPSITIPKIGITMHFLRNLAFPLRIVEIKSEIGQNLPICTKWTCVFSVSKMLAIRLELLQRGIRVLRVAVNLSKKTVDIYQNVTTADSLTAVFERRSRPVPDLAPKNAL